MRFPVRFNRAAWPELLTHILPSAADPRVLCHGQIDESTFAQAISAFKFGTAFKSAPKARFPLTILELASLPYEKRPIVIDLGATNGGASLEMLQAIPCEKYFVTDLNSDIFYQISGGATWFFDEKGLCFLMVTDQWIAYPETSGVIFPFDKLSQALFSRAPKWESDTARLRLINPLLQSHKESNFQIEKHNPLDPWPGENVDLIIAANILNRSFFTASEIKQVLENMLSALGDSGRIVIIESENKEQATIFNYSLGRVSVEKRVNGGVEIENLVLNSLGVTKLLALVNKSTEQV